MKIYMNITKLGPTQLGLAAQVHFYDKSRVGEGVAVDVAAVVLDVVGDE